MKLTRQNLSGAFSAVYLATIFAHRKPVFIIWVLYWLDHTVRSSKSHSAFVVGCLTILLAATIGSAGGTWYTLPDDLRTWDPGWLSHTFPSHSDRRPADLCSVIGGIVLPLTADALVVKSINLKFLKKIWKYFWRLGDVTMCAEATYGEYGIQWSCSR